MKGTSADMNRRESPCSYFLGTGHTAITRDAKRDSITRDFMVANSEKLWPVLCVKFGGEKKSFYCRNNAQKDDEILRIIRKIEMMYQYGTQKVSPKKIGTPQARYVTMRWN